MIFILDDFDSVFQYMNCFIIKKLFISMKSKYIKTRPSALVGPNLGTFINPYLSIWKEELRRIRLLDKVESILPYDSRISSLGSLEEKMDREGKEGWYLEKDLFFAEEK